MIQSRTKNRQQMKVDRQNQDTQYFTEHRSRNIRTSKRKLNILDQFQRRSPASGLKRTETSSPFKKQPTRSNSHRNYKLLLGVSKKPDADSSVRSKEYNQEYTGLVRMSDSIQHNKNRVDHLRQRVKLNATRSSDRFIGAYGGRPSRIGADKEFGTRRSSRPQIAPSSLERTRHKDNFQRRGDKEEKDASEVIKKQDDTFYKLLKKYASHIDSFKVLGEETEIPNGPNNLDRVWYYCQFCRYRNELEKLLTKLKELVKNSPNTQNLLTLQAFVLAFHQQNIKIQDAFLTIVNRLGKQNSLPVHLTRKEVCYLLREQIQAIDCKEGQNFDHTKRVRLLYKCISVTELLRRERFLKEFEQLFF